jgi:hypothetical protein
MKAASYDAARKGHRSTLVEQQTTAGRNAAAEGIWAITALLYGYRTSI